MDLSTAELRLVEEALEPRPAWLELAQTLEGEARTRASEALRALSMAFVYDLVEPAKESRRTNAGGPYVSMWTDDTGSSFPPAPRAVTPEIRAMWRATRDAVADPILVSRISDLLYVADGMAAHEDGRAAANALLELAHLASWTALDRAGCAARAIEILTELNDRATLATAASDACALVDELLLQEHPGPPFIVVRALVGLKADRRPSGLDVLLDRVVDRFTGHHAEEGAVALAERATSDQARRQALRRRGLQVRVDRAEAAEGLVKVTLLQRAIEFARAYGLNSEAEELLRRQQDLPKEDLGFRSVEASVSVPTDAVRRQVDLIVGSHAADIFDALDRFGSFGPPGGSNDDLDAEVDRQNRDFPLLNLFPQHVLGSATSTPRFIATDDDSKRLLARGRQRTIHADSVGSLLLAPMLDKAVAQHGRPEHSQLSDHFATELIGPARGERIARAVEFFWDHEYDSSAHVLVPRLESILRDVARASGIIIATPARDGRFAGLIPLSRVMTRLRELSPQDEWLDYFEALLCDPLALNLRNDIAHGIIPRVGKTGAALLIQAACFLRLLRRRAAEDSTTQ